MRRFLEIQPQITDDHSGSEPCLLEILEDYYDLCGIDNPKATAAEYVRQWLEWESRQCETIQAENANAV